MKAKIINLWDSEMMAIVSEDEDEKIHDFSDLKKAENVIIGEKLGKGVYDIMIDNEIGTVEFATMRHPASFDKVILCIFQ